MKKIADAVNDIFRSESYLCELYYKTVKWYVYDLLKEYDELEIKDAEDYDLWIKNIIHYIMNYDYDLLDRIQHDCTKDIETNQNRCLNLFFEKFSAEFVKTKDSIPQLRIKQEHKALI